MHEPVRQIGRACIRGNPEYQPLASLHTQRSDMKKCYRFPQESAS